MYATKEDREKKKEKAIYWNKGDIMDNTDKKYIIILSDSNILELIKRLRISDRLANAFKNTNKQSEFDIDRFDIEIVREWLSEI